MDPSSIKCIQCISSQAAKYHSYDASIWAKILHDATTAITVLDGQALCLTHLIRKIGY